MIKLLTHPLAFNWALVAMTLFACLRNSLAGNWMQAGYWLFAAGLNAIVTLGIK